MPVTIPATQAHRQLGELIRRVHSGKEHFVVEKDGLPVAALISINEYQQLMQEREQREERLKRFQETAKAIGKEFEKRGITEEQMGAQLEEIRQQLFDERYGESITNNS
jgi:prevent-host-death family protein